MVPKCFSLLNHVFYEVFSRNLNFTNVYNRRFWNLSTFFLQSMFILSLLLATCQQRDNVIFYELLVHKSKISLVCHFSNRTVTSCATLPIVPCSVSLLYCIKLDTVFEPQFLLNKKSKIYRVIHSAIYLNWWLKK